WVGSDDRPALLREGGAFPLVELLGGDTDLPLRPGDLEGDSGRVLVADDRWFDVVPSEDADELLLGLAVGVVHRGLPGRGERLLRGGRLRGDGGVVGLERGRL